MALPKRARAHQGLSTAGARWVAAGGSGPYAFYGRSPNDIRGTINTNGTEPHLGRIAPPAHSTLVPGAASSNTVCTGGVPEKPSSLQRATTWS
jgi:hypothetical protein